MQYSRDPLITGMLNLGKLMICVNK